MRVRHRDEFTPEFNKNKKIVMRACQGRCVKCGWKTPSLEVHHVYGYEDNRVEHLKPLCVLCHGIAPSGDPYWDWEKTGKSGAQLMIQEAVMPELRKDYPNISDVQFEIFFYPLFSRFLDLWYSEYRKQMMSKKTKDGIERAKLRGVRVGRPPVLSEDMMFDIVHLREKEKMSWRKIGERLGVSSVAAMNGFKAIPTSTVMDYYRRAKNPPKPFMEEEYEITL